MKKMTKLTTDEFILESKNIHGDKYFYDKTIFTRKKDRVIIVCPKHGEFQQIADNHLRGNGCMECSGKRLLTNDEFIEKSKFKHNNNYDYSLVEYKNNKTKVKIVCLRHGVFEQTAINHINGDGCPVCANNVKSTNFEFENKSSIVHNNKYLYYKSNYVNSKTKVIVVCPIHGDFKITPSNHLKGVGCTKCANKYKPTTIEFIEKCKNVHSDKYDYSKVEYINNLKSIEIICPDHGSFKQRSSHHLNGIGCPVCSKSSGEQFIENFLNKNMINFKSEYKFEDLKILKSLRFDFAIFDNSNNLKYLIEFNGKQHYFYNTRFHKSEIDFQDQLLRDNMKIKYCKDNNIKLYIIRYNDDLESILEKIIRENEEKNRI